MLWTQHRDWLILRLFCTYGSECDTSVCCVQDDCSYASFAFKWLNIQSLKPWETAETLKTSGSS